MIRRAKFQDIPQLVAIGREAHAASKYAGISELCDESFKRVLRQAIAGPDEPEWGATHCLVGTGLDGNVAGFIVGILLPVHLCLDIMAATNIYWYTKAGCPPTVGVRLLLKFHRWAERWPGKVIPQVSLADTMDEPQRIGGMLERIGFTKTGETYEMED